MIASVSHLLSGWLGRRRPPAVEAGPTAVIWWGSLSGGGGATIGDLRAVDNLSQALSAHGHDHQVLTSRTLSLDGHVAIDDLHSVGGDIRTIVFVCGPLVRHRRLAAFLDAWPSARKVAVGVSVLQRQSAMNARFEAILARDGTQADTFDLAICRTSPCLPPTGRWPLKVGLCFRGRQKEYGKGAAETLKAEGLLRDLAASLGGETATIDTVLRPGNEAGHIERQFLNADIVLTTRLHGALFALSHGKPTVAIDQIAGGGKVKPVLETVGWPAVFAVDSVDEQTLSETVAGFVETWPAGLLGSVQARIASASCAARDAAVNLVVNASTSRSPPGPRP